MPFFYPFPSLSHKQKGSGHIFTYIHRSKREIKWYLRRMSKDPTVQLINVSDYIPKNRLTMEEYLKADRDNFFTKFGWILKESSEVMLYARGYKPQDGRLSYNYYKANEDEDDAEDDDGL